MRQRFSTEEVLRSVPPLCVPILEGLLRASKQRKLPVYLVGGPVRDLLLGRGIRDVDVMVEASGLDSARKLAQAAARRDTRVIDHGRFGTVRMEAGEAHVDVATSRREKYTRAGSLPQVEAATCDEDLLRRDFTINALALRLFPAGSDRSAKVVDVVGGMRDLQEGCLRTLHPGSFHDDPTRILRAARLAPRLDFFLARSARGELRNALRNGVFGAVSGDRLRREFEAIFEDARRGLNPGLALRNLSQWHVLSALEPGLSLLPGARVPLRRLGRALAAPSWRAPRLRAWVPGLSLWLAGEKPALRRRALRRLSVRGSVALRIADFAKERDAKLRRLGRARGRGVVDGILAGIEEEVLLALYAAAEAPTRKRIERWAAEDRIRRSPVNGTDLAAIGLSGPALGRALGVIREAYLDGGVANREEALALGAEIARRPTRSPRRR